MFTKADLHRIAQIVRDETGNDVQEKNFPMLESRLRTHMLKMGIDSAQGYWGHFEKNERTEREVLQSLMTTHYTFFFREYAHFEVLDNWIKNEIDRLKDRYLKTKRPVRVWSAACSRGQEVYSLAMFLEVNLTKKFDIPYEIVGTDIDIESVKYGKNGVYPLKEVNTIPQMYLSSFWKKGTGAIKEFAAIHPNVKKHVHFEALNLLEVKNWKHNEPFDFIFCRNVFIYFSPENVKKIALDLAARLDVNGVLVSGLSEPLRFDGWDFASVGPSSYRNNKSSPVKHSGATSVSVPVAPQVVETQLHTPQKKYKVLCVDDSSTIQVLMKKIFSQDPNCESIDTAINGLDARKKLDAKQYDLITLDIHMPEMNGIEFLERAYKRKIDPPVIMVSSVNRTDVDLATKSLSLGAFDYVEKPAMNNLPKSTDEILAKAKMALRTNHKESPDIDTNFDQSIGQKIVVPDASQCTRIVLAGPDNFSHLEQIVKGQRNEYRSPALIIVWKGKEGSPRPETKIMDWTELPVVSVRDAKPMLKPNVIFIVDENQALDVGSFKAKNVSVQVVSRMAVPRWVSAGGAQIQVLVDEALSSYSSEVSTQSGLKVSDITPATSFASLSLEYFANIRKAAA